MLAEFFTKPLQGALFARMWDQILNLPTSKHTNLHKSVSGEDKKFEERWEHTSRGKGGKEAGISMELTEGPNKSKYKNEKKTKVGRSQRKDKGEKLSSGSHSS